MDGADQHRAGAGQSAPHPGFGWRTSDVCLARGGARTAHLAGSGACGACAGLCHVAGADDLYQLSGSGSSGHPPLRLAVANPERFEAGMGELGADDHRVPVTHLHWFSDLDTDQACGFRKTFGGLPLDARRRLLEQMAEAAEDNFELDFSSIWRTT